MPGPRLILSVWPIVWSTTRGNSPAGRSSAWRSPGAIVTDAAIILADEPTGDLDAASAKDVLTILSRLNQQHEKTVIIVTHDPNAAKYARRILYLEKRRLAR